MMDKANQALSYLASGNIPNNTNSLFCIKEKELELKFFRKPKYCCVITCIFCYHSILTFNEKFKNKKF